MSTREAVTAAVADAAVERDAIQANLLDLDGSFGKRLLAGAPLAGETKKQWDAASAELATLWEIFATYSAVVDRAAERMAQLRRPGAPELAEITALLTGPSVRLTRAQAPLNRRDLDDTGRLEITPAAAVTEMKRAFARVTDVVSAAESVWNEVAGLLDAAGAELSRVRPLAAGLGDDALTGALAAAEAELSRQRDALNADPLALRQRGRTDTASADRLRDQIAATAARIDELARLRDDARRRITEAAAAVAAARAARQDAAAAWQRAAARIAASGLPPLPPDTADLSGRLAALDALAASGRWTRLESELDAIEQESGAATKKNRDTERTVVAVLGRRDELRGLLDAYRAKAARLGAAEDASLAERYERVRDLLWTAPCDLAAAADAVTGYQQAVLTLSGPGLGRQGERQ